MTFTPPLRKLGKKIVPHSFSLKQYFFVIVLFNSLSVLLCAILGYHVYTNAYNQLLSSSIAGSLSVTSAQISQTMENIEYISTLILSSSSIQNELSNTPQPSDAPGMAEYNRAVNAALSEYSALFHSNCIAYVALFNGNNTNSTNWALLKKTSDTLLETAISNGEERSGAVTWTSMRRGEYLLLSRNIREIDNLSLKSLGTLVIAVDIEKLVTNGTQFASANPGQQFIFATGSKKILYASSALSDEDTAKLLQEKVETWKIETCQGHKYFVIKGAIPHYDYQYLSLAPYDDIAGALQTSLQLITFILIAGMIFIMYVSNRLIRAIIRQFDLLNERMSAFSQDELEIIGSNDHSIAAQPKEIQALHHNFTEMATRIQELVQVNYANKLLAKDAQLRALRSQINPHFLYNTLETINWRAKATGNKQISQIAESLGNLLRASLSSQKPLVSLSYELNLVDSFITIQKIRFEEQLDFHSEISPEALTGVIPPLTIQPLVENAIHYGMEQMVDTCRIDLKAQVEDQKLIILVENDGSVFEEDLLNKLRNKSKIPNGFGIGLLNIDERIQLIFGSEYGLMLSNRNGRAVAQLLLPLRGEEDFHAEAINS